LLPGVPGKLPGNTEMLAVRRWPHHADDPVSKSAPLPQRR